LVERIVLPRRCVIRRGDRVIDIFARNQRVVGFRWETLGNGGALHEFGGGDDRKASLAFIDQLGEVAATLASHEIAVERLTASEAKEFANGALAGMTLAEITRTALRARETRATAHRNVVSFSKISVDSAFVAVPVTDGSDGPSDSDRARRPGATRSGSARVDNLIAFLEPGAADLNWVDEDRRLGFPTSAPGYSDGSQRQALHQRLLAWNAEVSGGKRTDARLVLAIGPTNDRLAAVFAVDHGSSLYAEVRLARLGRLATEWTDTEGRG